MNSRRFVSSMGTSSNIAPPTQSWLAIVEIGGVSADQHRTLSVSSPQVKLDPHFQQIFRCPERDPTTENPQSALGKHTVLDA
jgi:hypothetical protein